MSEMENRGIEQNKPVFFGSYRPKIWLRRCKDQNKQLAIRQYILNVGTANEAYALELLRSRL